MKTPKRYHKIPAERAHLDLEPDSWEPDYHVQEARWKRKNRIAQLKRTIARLSIENFELKIELGLPTHISFEEYNSRYVDFIKPDCISDF